MGGAPETSPAVRKGWLRSSTIRWLVVVAILAALDAFNIELDIGTVEGGVNHLLELFGVVMAARGRARADTPLG